MYWTQSNIPTASAAFFSLKKVTFICISNRTVCRTSVVNLQEKRPLGRYRQRRKGNIKIIFYEFVWQRIGTKS